MAILIVEQNGAVEGASLSGRILIGRQPVNHIVVDHPDVSRIHAWIDTAGNQFCLTDAASRTGTFVNGQRVTGSVPIHHGDRISVGPARLIFRADGSLPAGVSQLKFQAGPRKADGGILFDCTCGAPLWIDAAFAGRLGKCRYCGKVVQIPDAASAAPARAQPAAAPSISCGVCQSPIEAGEPSTTCPECGLVFHAECWTANYGCSAYGCSQVNVLAPAPEALAAAASTPSAPDASEEEPPQSPRIPPEHGLLAASVAGLLLGALTFGVPALLSLVGIGVYLKSVPNRRPSGVIIAAAALSLVGIFAGIVVSYIWWLADAPGVMGAALIGSDRG